MRTEHDHSQVVQVSACAWNADADDLCSMADPFGNCATLQVIECAGVEFTDIRDMVMFRLASDEAERIHCDEAEMRAFIAPAAHPSQPSSVGVLQPLVADLFGDRARVVPVTYAAFLMPGIMAATALMVRLRTAARRRCREIDFKVAPFRM